MDNNHKKILIIDDSVDSTLHMSELLSYMGYEIAIAHTGATAISVADQFIPDFILMDIGLPDMTGFEVGVQIKARRHLQRCRIFAVTGYDLQIALANTQAAGFDWHFVKPVEVAEIDRVIKMFS